MEMRFFIVSDHSGPRGSLGGGNGNVCRKGLQKSNVLFKYNPKS